MNDMELSLDLITEYYLEELDNIEMEYTEKVNPLAPIDAIIRVFYAYVAQIKKIREEKKDFEYLKRGMGHCLYLTKHVPELKNKKFILVHMLQEEVIVDQYVLNRYAKNIATALIHHDKDGIMDIMEQYLLASSMGSTKYMRKINLQEAYDLMDYCLRALYSNIDNDTKMIKNVRKMIEKSANYNYITMVDLFKRMIDTMMRNIYRRDRIINANIDDCLFGIKEGLTKKIEGYSDNCIKKIDPALVSDDEIKKHSELVNVISWGDKKFQVYKTEYPNVSAFNCGGLHIFVSNDFFKHSKEMQNAILYHEMGHYYKKHFNEVSLFHDDRELVKRVYQIRKEFKKFCKKNKLRCNNTNTTLATLLMELDADRIAVTYSGKRLTKKSLDQTLNGYINNSDSMSDARKFDMKMNTRFRQHMIDKLQKDDNIL